MAKELPKTYDPASFHDAVLEKWNDSGVFQADPDERGPDQRFVIMMPLPNVTGALHMGHAINNSLQDLLIRWSRMQGKNTLWQSGTDHAGIATQAVVEKRLKELEGKTRHDVGREGLIERIWQWKDEYQARIISQLQSIGASCDWRRTRFTMDAVCSRAVRENFFRLFRDGLIYRGNRLVNWDCQLQTAVSDDEVYHETVQGHFWHLRYPVIDSADGEPDHVTVATTRPETMLGDTAVAVHPEPRKALNARIEEQKARVEEASEKEREAAEAELARLEARLESHLDRLEQLVQMAQAGRKVRLPLMDREIPLILDEWAKPELGSGCVKITPAHDANDYDVWQRHTDQISAINILNPDGTLNASAGAYSGQDRFEARKNVVADLKEQGLLESIEEREIEIGHSDRSKTPVEPYLSEQWFVRMGDVEGGVVMARGTEREYTTPGLAQAAMDAVEANDLLPTDDRLAFHPARYKGQYVAWLSEKRDWCISRQLWWGHRIPVWRATLTLEEIDDFKKKLPADSDEIFVDVEEGGESTVELLVCLRSAAADEKHAAALEDLGLEQDPDVLDTWFSSALWPFSTLGWPDPETAPIEDGQVPLGARDGHPNAFEYYYPGSVLVTSRDIITLWVARMLIMGLYNHGIVPFTDTFIHLKLLDGKGVTMSKSKGNGVDPLDIVSRYGVDAMRYLIFDMETGMQDVRLPVQADCPNCSKRVELTDAQHGTTMFTWRCTHCNEEFDVLGTMKDQGIPAATVYSDRFDNGQRFCNKLWNVSRFCLMKLGDEPLEFRPLKDDDLEPEDRWILSRLNTAIDDVSTALAEYRISQSLNLARDYTWNELCDWYVEFVKPRLADEKKAPVARQVLATVLDQTLRLLHPFIPFVTEAIWESLGELAPERGIAEKLEGRELCTTALWPTTRSEWADDALESDFVTVRELTQAARELRSRYNVAPRKELPATVQASGEALRVASEYQSLIMTMANLSSLEAGESVEKPANAATRVTEGGVSVSVGDVLDPEAERKRLTKQKEQLSKQLAGTEKKLANEGFVSKAPEHVVEAERAKLEDLKSQLELVEKDLAGLG